MAKNTNKVAKAWGGVFTESTDAQMEKFSESISFDSRMYAQDIRGSIGHARMLADVGILTNEEFEAIERELLAIKARIEAGDFEYSTALEDIHMHVEKALIEKLGDVGRKLHTARSRNDQVSTDFRLWIRDAIDALRAEGRRIYALETADGATDISRFSPVFPCALLLGNERFGLDPDVVAMADEVLEIPSHGQKNSLNVVSAFAVAAAFFRSSSSVDSSQPQKNAKN